MEADGEIVESFRHGEGQQSEEPLDTLDTRSFYDQSFALLPAVKSKIFSKPKKFDPSNFGSNGIRRSDKFTLNCWNAFQKYARPLSASKCISPPHLLGEMGDHLELSIQFLQRAVLLVHPDARLEEIEKLASDLEWHSKETVPWERFKYFCWELFHKSLQFRQKAVNVDSQVPMDSHAAFDQLERKQKYISSMGLDSQYDISSTFQSQSSRIRGVAASSVEKDGLTEIIKREVRSNIRHNGINTSFCSTAELMKILKIYLNVMQTTSYMEISFLGMQPN